MITSIGIRLSGHRMTLHTLYRPSIGIHERVAAWDAATRREAGLPMTSWQIAAIWHEARGATIGASTAIEGNPLTQAQVDEVLAGGRVEAAGPAIREIENYSEAMNVAARAADRGFEWSEDVISEINAAVTRGPDPDTGGRYRN
jgi:Fic family protein